MQMHIERCVCVENEDLNKLPPGKDGMPILHTYQGLDNQVWWGIECPRCGRGSIFDNHKSAKAALKDWNKLQSHLKTINYTNLCRCKCLRP